MDEYKRFAWLYDLVLYPVIRKVRKRISEIIRKHNAESIIDICCGTGDQLKYLRKQGYRNITGVDISQSMLKQANKGQTKAECYNQDASALRFDADSFDAGIIGYALHEKPIDTAKKILKEAKRVIKPGGLLIILDYNQEQNAPFYTRAMVHFIERFAGKSHYKNFRQYQKEGGLNALMNSQTPINNYKFHGGITLLHVYKN
jgi:demethylmenaquinone methyltransferase/2-methoxy-6-polyprenyl-1,4-benzoquinol methylase